jgi:hypothetical protein
MSTIITVHKALVLNSTFLSGEVTSGNNARAGLIKFNGWNPGILETYLLLFVLNKLYLIWDFLHKLKKFKSTCKINLIIII